MRANGLLSKKQKTWANDVKQRKSYIYNIISEPEYLHVHKL